MCPQKFSTPRPSGRGFPELGARAAVRPRTDCECDRATVAFQDGAEVGAEAIALKDLRPSGDESKD
jgi:hypothetical protein